MTTTVTVMENTGIDTETETINTVTITTTDRRITNLLGATNERDPATARNRSTNEISSARSRTTIASVTEILSAKNPTKSAIPGATEIDLAK